MCYFVLRYIPLGRYSQNIKFKVNDNKYFFLCVYTSDLKDSLFQVIFRFLMALFSFLI